MSSDLVSFRGGFVASMEVVAGVIDLEFRGFSFRLVDGGRFRVSPQERLTDQDTAFLRSRRDEVRRVLEYIDRLEEQPV